MIKNYVRDFKMMPITMIKIPPLIGLCLLSLSTLSYVHAETSFAEELHQSCSKIQTDARLGKQAYDQEKYQLALKHFKDQARWSAFCQNNDEDNLLKISKRDIELAFNNVGLTYQKLGQNNWARAWFAIFPQSSISQHNLKRLPALTQNSTISGKYVKYAGYGEWNTVEVTATKAEYMIRFSGLYMGLRSLIYGPNMGDFDTTMAKNRKQTTYQYEKCQLNLNFSTAQRLQITYADQNYDCGFGHNVSATGDYLKVE